MNTLAFPAATGNDDLAAVFVAHWMSPIFDHPYAIDSRRVDDLWVHQLHEEPADTLALRAQLAAAWKQRADLEAEEWAS